MDNSCIFEQDMAAIVCVFEHKCPVVVAAYRTAHEAWDALAGMRESGEANTWGGKLVVAEGDIAMMRLDVPRLLKDPRVGIDGERADAIIEKTRANIEFMKRLNGLS